MSRFDDALAASGTVLVGNSPAVAQMVAAASAYGWRAVELDGTRCHDKASLLVEVARTMQFPAHFGHNWDALVDCLRDRDGWCMVWRRPRRLHRDDPSSAEAFTSIVDEVAADGVRLLLIVRG